MVLSGRYCVSGQRRENLRGMKPTPNSRLADVHAAIDRLHKKHSWKATKAVNGGPTTRLRLCIARLPLWAAAVLLLLGLLAASLIWRAATHDYQPLFPGRFPGYRHHWHKPFESPRLCLDHADPPSVGPNIKAFMAAGAPLAAFSGRKSYPCPCSG